MRPASADGVARVAGALPLAATFFAVDDSSLSRRRVLRVGGGGVLALVIGGVAGWADRRDDPAPDPVAAPRPTTTTTTTTAAPLVLPEIGEVDPAIVRLGRRVVEVTGDDDLPALLAALPAAEGDPVRAASRRVHEEFAAGETVAIDGWILAVSEARATAVIALLCDEAEC